MSPLSLVFSSDEETSRKVGQALHELDLEVELCPEIFTSIEKITSRKFEVIVTDWDEGLEASFLLKTSRELKSNQSAFTIAIASSASGIAADACGANLVLAKPIVVDQAKYAMLTCDEFLLRMKTWLPKATSNSPESETAQVGEHRPPSEAEPMPRITAEEYRAASRLQRLPEASPTACNEHVPHLVSPPATSRPSTLESDPFHLHQSTGIQTLFSTARPAKVAINVTKVKPKNRFGSFLRGASFGVAFLSVGYAFSEPARSEAVAVSVAHIYEKAVSKTQDWFHPSDDADDDLTADGAQPSPRQAGPRRLLATRNRTGEARDISVEDVENESAESQRLPGPQTQQNPQDPTEQIAAASFGPLIPESLKSPIDSNPGHSAAPRPTTSLLGAVEPVRLPADLAERLLLQKIQPSYPTSALQAKLQGSVVLEACIGRDGSIRDLKLLNGSLLLGQAAYRAVKQWRYKPYLLNGRAVEAQTLVTVDFRLPQ